MSADDPEDLAAKDLERSGIDLDAADGAGMYVDDDAREVFETFKPLPVLAIPYFDPVTKEPVTFEREGKTYDFHRVRYLVEPPAARGFIKKKSRRYDQPPGSGVHAYFPITDQVDWSEVYEDPEIPVVITEGEKKALRGCMSAVPTLGLGGVYNFMSDDRLLDSLDRLCVAGRDFYICFDSDAASNPDIQAAEGRLATELSLKRGARVFLARIPEPKLKKGEKRKDLPKIGLDDYIVEHGDDKFMDLLENAQQMRKIDAAVLGLNRSIAWIEEEGAVVDTETNGFIRKDNLVSGSRFAPLEVMVPTLKGTGQKRLSVAAEWLVHPHAQRFHSVTFNPNSQDKIVKDEDGREALNLWRGWSPEDGDVMPFLELTEYLTSRLPDDQQELALKLLAYKAQNPGQKVPLALVLVGTQGCGKSLWAKIVREAFAPYGAVISSKALLSEFNGWIESSLMCVIDEAQSVHLTKGADTLKSLISDERQYLNDKFRKARQVTSYTMYILTSNDRRVAAYSGDDRRMVVIDCPDKREDAFYDRVLDWQRNSDGPKRLLSYLLNYDLAGWMPPKTAPMTAEKYMAYMESLTPIEALAEDMKTANHNIVKMWVDSALEWAKAVEVDGSNRNAAQAREIKTALTRLQIRPFYTPEELAMIFPAIVESLHGSRGMTATPAGEISRQLRQCGINYLQNKDDPRGFRWRGAVRRYLVIAEPEEWTTPLSQNEFERIMKRFPSYGTFNAMLDAAE